jgi:HTH-type transcriptional regulator/antitoxin HigA
MGIIPIRTEKEYHEALRSIEILMSAVPGTPEGDQLEVLAILVEDYERRYYPLDQPDPVESIKFHMERRGMAPKDLQPMIGRMNRVYEVLNNTRPLTLPMIRKLHRQMGIPAESLISEPVRHE